MLRPPDSTHGPFPEKTTATITATVKDQAGVAIPGASLTSMVWTLYTEHDDPTLTIINSRSAVSCIAGVSAAGVLTLTLDPLDMAILDTTLGEERHRVLFVWTYSGGKTGRHEVRVRVSNVAKVT